MLGFGHQTVFNLCMGLILLATVSVVCVALLFLERQDMAVLQRNINSLEQENAALRLQLQHARTPGAAGSTVQTTSFE